MCWRLAWLFVFVDDAVVCVYVCVCVSACVCVCKVSCQTAQQRRGSVGVWGGWVGVASSKASIHTKSHTYLLLELLLLCAIPGHNLLKHARGLRRRVLGVAVCCAVGWVGVCRRDVGCLACWGCVAG